jgi:hypothetical protein
MDAAQAADGYLISEVRIEQWVLAALQMQHGLSLRPRRRSRRKARPAARSMPTRGSLWLMLGACCLGLVLL